jgi:hypothetical protein
MSPQGRARKLKCLPAGELAALNRAQRLITKQPVIALQDITNIIQAYITAAGIRLSDVFIEGFDVNRILAEVTLIMMEFESPGSGFAVPSYLNR